MRFMQLVISV